MILTRNVCIPLTVLRQTLISKRISPFNLTHLNPWHSKLSLNWCIDEYDWKSGGEDEMQTQT